METTLAEAPSGQRGGELRGMTVGITADRRWREQADLFRRRGAEVVHGPTLVTIDLSRQEALRQATLDVVARPPELVVVTTGMGLSLWLEAAAGWGLDDRLTGALAQAAVLARGAKASSAVRRAGLQVAWRAPRETMEEVVDHIATEHPQRPRVALQLFGPEAHPSTAALRALAGELVEIPVYRWRLPDDQQPARALVQAVTAGEVAAVTFTSQPAVHHLFRIAESMGRADALRRRFGSEVVASCVGPVCAESAVAEGIERPVWPEPPRLVAMVRQLTELLVSRSA